MLHVPVLHTPRPPSDTTPFGASPVFGSIAESPSPVGAVSGFGGRSDGLPYCGGLFDFAMHATTTIANAAKPSFDIRYLPRRGYQVFDDAIRTTVVCSTAPEIGVADEPAFLMSG